MYVRPNVGWWLLSQCLANTLQAFVSIFSLFSLKIEINSEKNQKKVQKIRQSIGERKYRVLQTIEEKKYSTLQTVLLAVIEKRKYSKLEIVGEKKYNILYTVLLTLHTIDNTTEGREYSTLQYIYKTTHCYAYIDY